MTAWDRLSGRSVRALVCVAALWPAAASAQAVTCGPKEVRPSLVRIERAPGLRGTGVVIVRRDSYVVILSVKHVMEAEDDDFFMTFAVAPNRRIRARWDGASIVGRTPDSDLVVFRVDTPVPDGVEPEDPFLRESPMSAAVVAWGYPSSGAALCSYETKLDRLFSGQLVAAGEVPEGVSGGPMFVVDPDDKRPKLAGIVARGDATGTYAIDIRQAATIVSTSPHKANGNKPYPWPNIQLPAQLRVASIPNLSFQRVGRGAFVMGSDVVGDERWNGPQPALPSFYMGTYEVTRGQYNECVAANVCRRISTEGLSPQDANLPVVNVTWEDATTYATWLQRRLAGRPDTDRTLRRLFDAGWTVVLPSEAEWEKAARKFEPGKRSATVYPWGDRPHEGGANFNTGRLRPVNQSKCEGCAYELFDMAGNVWEWTRSLKVPYPYSPVAAERPAAPGNRVIRGGSYKREENAPVAASIVRSSNREDAPRTRQDPYIGFRVALICARDGDNPCVWEEAE